MTTNQSGHSQSRARSVPTANQQSMEAANRNALTPLRLQFRILTPIPTSLHLE